MFTNPKADPESAYVLPICLSELPSQDESWLMGYVLCNPVRLLTVDFFRFPSCHNNGRAVR